MTFSWLTISTFNNCVYDDPTNNNHMSYGMENNTVTRRKVFYVCGFDPRSSRFYHNLYKKESNKWSSSTGKQIKISARCNTSPTTCDWQAVNSSDDVVCDYSYLIWDDIIRKKWMRNPLTLLMAALTTYIGLIKNINWTFANSLSKGPIKALFYPLFSLLFSIILTTVSATLAFSFLPTIIAWLTVLGVALGSGYWLFIKVQSFWLLQLFIYHYGIFTNPSKELDIRLNQFAEQIAHSLRESAELYDEILLVGHSHGTVLAPIIASRIERALNQDLPRNFHLVTLGNLMPFATGLKNLNQFKTDVLHLAQCPIDWYDISSPADGVCFPQTQPLAPLTEPKQLTVHLLSPRFHKYYHPENYAQLKKDRLELHFQYLCSTDLPSPTSFIAMTAGNQPIEAIL